MGSWIKEHLRSLCFDNGWSYGVFWSVHRRNPMLLTLEDAFYGEQMGIIMDKMLQRVHMLGEGIIGQAALTGKNRWLSSDTYCGEWSPTWSVGNQDVFQENSEFRRQFSSGIKTIVVISVAPQGVVQFGSTQKILERSEFVDHTRSLFRQMESVDCCSLTDWNSEIYDSSGSFASVVLSGNSYSNYGNIKPLHDESCKQLMGKAHSSTVLTQPSPFTSDLHPGSMPPLINNSVHIKNQFQMAGTEAQVILSTPSMESSKVFLQSSSSSTNDTVARHPTMSTWSSEGSTLTSFEQQLLSRMGTHGYLHTSSANLDDTISFRNTFMNLQGDSTFTPLYSIGESLDMVTKTGLLEANKPIENGLGKWVDIQQSTLLPHPNESEHPKGSTSFPTYPGKSRPSSATTALSKASLVNNLSQLVAPPLEPVDNGLAAATLKDNLSQALVSVSSGAARGDVFSSISNHVVVQNSITNTTNSFGAVCDVEVNSLKVPMQLPAENDLFDSLGFGLCQGQDCWDDIIMPLESSSYLNLSTGIPECIPELDVSSMTGPQTGFFSEFGIEQLLDDVVGISNSTTKPSSEDSTSTITRTGSTSGYWNKIQLAGPACLEGSMNVMMPEYNPEKVNMLGTQKESVPKSQVGSWIEDSYSINAENTASTQPKRPEEPAKVTRKRARPGESTRPRPKDRQQIQDRVKELREIVPHGAKCSIDALLARTIKHMVFLQSITKYADKLKQAIEPKMIGHESSSGGSGGTTWAFEVGDQTMVCPIIVEDLSSSGQMLVEMLCEEQGFFLEIADIIKGFGLTILKGIMEVREDKIWAQFIVEANRDVTRMDVFLSLVQLLQQTATSGIGSSNQPSKVVDSGVQLFTNYLQSPTPLPISLADRM